MNDDVDQWERRTGKRVENEMHLEYAVPCLDRGPCRRIFGNDRVAAEEYAADKGGVIELRLVTHWLPV